MSKEAYRQKLEAQIDEQSAKLEVARAKAKGGAADVRLEAEKQIGVLDEKIDAAKAQLSKLADAGEDAWEGLKDGVENAWEDLSKTSKSFFAKFTG